MTLFGSELRDGEVILASRKPLQCFQYLLGDWDTGYLPAPPDTVPSLTGDENGHFSVYGPGASKTLEQFSETF